MPVLEWSETARCDLLAIVYMEDPHVVTVLRVLHAARRWPPGSDHATI